jgi:hypothetical protein
LWTDLLGRDVTITIERVRIDELVRKGGAKEKKGVVYIVGRDKMWVLNRTNADTIVKLYGRETEGWHGKRVTLYPTTATFGRETVPCIRVRPQVPAAKGERPPAPPPRPEGAVDPEDEPPLPGAAEDEDGTDLFSGGN